VLVEVALDVDRVDRVVVGNLELVELGAEVLQPVAHAFAEDAGDEVEHVSARPDERARGCLEPKHGLALHEQDVALREEDLRQLPLRAAEPLHEGGVVVVRDLLGLRGKHARVRHGGPGAQREVGIAHDAHSFRYRDPRSYGSASAAGTSARYQSLIAQASTEAVLALQLDSLNVLALAYQAEIYADQQQYTQASQYAERAMALNPNSFDTLRVSGYVLEAGENYAAAIERYKQAAEVAPNQTFIYIRIGQNYRELGLYDQALEYFDRAASINEALGIDDPLPYIAIAKTYARMGEFFAAALNAEKAIDLDPTNPDWYGQLGIIYFRARNYESSIPVLRCAVSGCSDAQNSADSEGRWVTSVNGLPLDNNTLAYYYTFGSVLAALEQCGEAMPILTALSEAYAGDAVVMLIVNEGINICQGTVASDGEN